MDDFQVPQDQIELADLFLTKFTIVSESSMQDHLDIMLMLKALPNKILLTTLESTEQFHFKIFQESLIAFQNRDLVNAFEYIDDKNRERMQNVKEKQIHERANLDEIKETLSLVKVNLLRQEEFLQKKKDEISGTKQQTITN